MARSSVWLAVSLCLIAIALPPAHAGPGESWLLIPGQGLGPLRLGMTPRALAQAAGWSQPDRTHAVGSITYLHYGRPGVTFAVRDDAVVLILTTNERYRTDRGVAVGQAVAAAAATYGAVAAGGDERVQWYDALGLVVVTGGGTIVRLGVFDPKAFVRTILVDEQPARDVFLTARPPKYFGGADAGAAGATRSVVVTVALKNTSRRMKVLNPNYFTLIDREGKAYLYDRSTFRQPDACRSTISVRPGETGTCSVSFVIPAGQHARAIVFNDSASTDEFHF